MEKREGYGHLLSYFIRLGDLLLLNGLYIGLLYFMIYNKSITSFTTQDLVIYITFLNLTYFFVCSIIKVNTIEHFVFFDKVIQKASALILMYMLCFTVLLAISNLFIIPRFEWITGNVIIGGVFVAWHTLFRIILKRYRKKGRNYRYVAIIGCDGASLELYEDLDETAYGYKVVGYFSDTVYDGDKEFPPYLGTSLSVEEYIRTHRLDELYYASNQSRDKYVKPLMKLCENNMIRFFLVPEFYKYVRRRMVINILNNTPVLSLRNEPLQDPVNRLLKRMVDLGISVVVLLTIFPIIYIIFGTIIKITSPGPVFFNKKGLVYKGRSFIVINSVQCVKIKLQI